MKYQQDEYLEIPSESVGLGHPDKLADFVSDSILDEALSQDPHSRVAIETMVKDNKLILGGEITTQAKLDYERIARNAVRIVGYDSLEKGMDWKTLTFENNLGMQSPDISQGVTAVDNKEQGAGDQGLMWGYATNEAAEFMPLGPVLAHKLVMKLSALQNSGEVQWLRPDCKSQVTVLYDDNWNPMYYVSNVVLAAQHDESVSLENIRKTLEELVIKDVCSEYIDEDTKFYVNGTGKFVIGGPTGDCGLTGRKIIVDTYAGLERHGGGAFSGKDPSKVDRSANYQARYIAKNIVAAGLAERCSVALSYCIGVAEPTSVAVDTHGTGKVPRRELTQVVRKIFPLKPAAIIAHHDLKHPDMDNWSYRDTAAYGHFGRNAFPWERVDKVEELKSYFGM